MDSFKSLKSSKNVFFQKPKKNTGRLKSSVLSLNLEDLLTGLEWRWRAGPPHFTHNVLSHCLPLTPQQHSSYPKVSGLFKLYCVCVWLLSLTVRSFVCLLLKKLSSRTVEGLTGGTKSILCFVLFVCCLGVGEPEAARESGVWRGACNLLFFHTVVYIVLVMLMCLFVSLRR